MKILATVFACFSLILLSTTSCAPVANGYMVGSQALDFELPSINGDNISLSDYRGRPVVVNFWALSCPYCLAEMPYLHSIYDTYANQEPGLMVLTINIGDSSSNISNYLTNSGINLPVLLDSNGKIAGQYGVTGIPVTKYRVQNGIIKDKVLGAFPSLGMLENKLLSILN